MKNILKKLEPKFLYVSMKDTNNPAKAGGICLLLFEIVILMQDEVHDFKNWTCPKSLLFV